MPADAVFARCVLLPDPQDGSIQLIRWADVADYSELVVHGSLGNLMTYGIIERPHATPVNGVRQAHTCEGPCIRFKYHGVMSSLARKRGVLVHHGEDHVDLEVVAFIRAERESRSRRIAPGRSSMTGRA